MIARRLVWSVRLAAVAGVSAWAAVATAPAPVAEPFARVERRAPAIVLTSLVAVEAVTPEGGLRRRVVMAAPPAPTADPSAPPASPPAPAPPPPTTPTSQATPPVPVPSTDGCANPDRSKVLLTFDDGGDQAPAILEILNRYGVKARWFPTGDWAQSHPDVVRTLLDSGQLLGNHTRSHPKMLSNLGPDELRRQVDQGYHPSTVLRFPYGASDAGSRDLVTGMGYSICAWTIDTRDWQGATAQGTTDLVTGQAGPGSVVLMHLRFPADVAALPGVIENLRGRGLI